MRTRQRGWSSNCWAAKGLSAFHDLNYVFGNVMKGCGGDEIWLLIVAEFVLRSWNLCALGTLGIKAI